jgi:hypothetical protein
VAGAVTAGARRGAGSSADPREVFLLSGKSGLAQGQVPPPEALALADEMLLRLADQYAGGWAKESVGLWDVETFSAKGAEDGAESAMGWEWLADEHEANASDGVSAIFGDPDDGHFAVVKPRAADPKEVFLPSGKAGFAQGQVPPPEALALADELLERIAPVGGAAFQGSEDWKVEAYSAQRSVSDDEREESWEWLNDEYDSVASDGTSAVFGAPDDGHFVVVKPGAVEPSDD